jgi:non-canonical poly(A) RNA polymerase PAPD5/7
MLNPLHSNGPEQFFFDTHAGATYRPVDELSDSDEAEMDISEGEGDATEPSSKRARLSNQKSAAADLAPKWSNPDPYTALPPPDTAGKPRKDVVQLIRKARVETTESKASIPAEAADFIACDFDDSDDENASDVVITHERPVPNRDVSGGGAEGGGGGAAAPTGAPTGPRSGAQAVDNTRSGPADTNSLPSQIVPGQQPAHPLPAKPSAKTIATPAQTATGRSADGALGSRKRTHDDEIKLPAHAKLKKVTKVPGRGGLAQEWRIVNDENPRPWLVMDHSASTNMGNW